MHNDDLSRATWRTSSYSGNSGNCVEVAVAESVVGVRDSTNRDSGVLVVSREEWRKFANALK
jgi:hypothetical protein